MAKEEQLVRRVCFAQHLPDKKPQSVAPCIEVTADHSTKHTTHRLWQKMSFAVLSRLNPAQACSDAVFPIQNALQHSSILTHNLLFDILEECPHLVELATAKTQSTLAFSPRVLASQSVCTWRCRPGRHPRTCRPCPCPSAVTPEPDTQPPRPNPVQSRKAVKIKPSKVKIEPCNTKHSIVTHDHSSSMQIQRRQMEIYFSGYKFPLTQQKGQVPIPSR